MTDPERRLVEILAARQKSSGLSDTKWARHIGTTQPHWWRLTHGQRGIGKRFAQKVLVHFPELWKEVQAIFLP